jgi:hypothetical protein
MGKRKRLQWVNSRPFQCRHGDGKGMRREREGEERKKRRSIEELSNPPR